MEYEIIKSRSFITFEEYIKNNNIINNDNSNWGFYVDIENQNTKNIIHLQRSKNIKKHSNILKMQIIKEENEDDDDESKFEKSNIDLYIIFGLLVICVTVLMKI